MSGLFHTLVVYGAAVSLAGCGGNVSSGTNQSGTPDGNEGRDGGNSEGAGSGGAGSSRAAGGVANAGAASGGASSKGGASSNGGVTLDPSSGGAPAAGGTPGAGGLIEPPNKLSDFDPRDLAQWDCSEQFTDCSGGAFVIESPACPADTTRPRQPSDCSPDEWFECLRANTGPSSATVYVNCACVPMADGTCMPCAYDFGRVGVDSATCEGQRKVCDCFTGILR